MKQGKEDQSELVGGLSCNLKQEVCVEFIDRLLLEQRLEEVDKVRHSEGKGFPDTEKSKCKSPNAAMSWYVQGQQDTNVTEVGDRQGWVRERKGSEIRSWGSCGVS